MNFRSLLCKFSIAVGFLIVFTQCSINKKMDGVLLGNGHNSDYTIIEKYWKLIVINGKPIVFSEREPYIILKQEENKVIGFGACNPLNAKYELSPKNKISFSNLTSSDILCAVMKTEQDFFQALKETVSYDVDGDTLVLKNTIKQPIAIFEAIYLK